MKYSVVVGSLLASAMAVQEQQPVKPVAEGQPAGRARRFDVDMTVEDRLPKTKAVEHPDFEPWPRPEVAFKEAVLFEQFSGNAKSLFEKWRVSSAKKAGQEDEFSYVGRWAIEEPSVIPGFKGDKGLVLKTPAAHHAISRKFDKPLDNKDKTLVLQYEVKLQKGLQCGGAYVKLISASYDLEEHEFSNDAPYQVMFGPDKCGSTDKVHLIIRRKDPKTGEYEEKQLTAPPRTRGGEVSNLYTLILHPNQDYEIRINGQVAKAGSLIDEGTFNPPLNPPKEIDDENDTKPDDWVDEIAIPDPEQTVKPDDWDESAPMRIPDESAEKPEDWREDLVTYIPDPEADKPEEWDDEEDGEWLAPLVPNPECLQLSGCGPWTAPTIRNPDYKGKWIQPTIPNPSYKGPWKPRKIPNPEYWEDARPSDLEPIGAIGLELWTMQPDILFDNFYIGHSVIEAEDLGNGTFSSKLYVETLEANANAPSNAGSADGSVWEQFKADPVAFAATAYNQFIDEFTQNKLLAIRNQPAFFVVLLTGFTLISSVLFGIINVILALLTGKQLPAVEANAAAATTSETKSESKSESSDSTTATGSDKSTVRKRKD